MSHISRSNFTTLQRFDPRLFQTQRGLDQPNLSARPAPSKTVQNTHYKVHFLHLAPVHARPMTIQATAFQ